ncbi:NAD-dependent epimerase/dehydratase family protein [Streptomyces sp. 21So2-11]|uniref:NAD-dependent epimerase/dehydratase family protein n=1 Tax=Streptomyces sp. 21So2-11 TaxID=3144408 RepID=UPI0032196561
MRETCVIGGSRYFGKRLVVRLIESGVKVTVINRGSRDVPDGVTHLVADRNDEAALNMVLGDREFDVVIDQICYTPQQAAIAKRVFAGRTGRYVMTSTMEVYDPATSQAIRPARPGLPLTESAVDPAGWPVDLDQSYEYRYAEGKRQAEAVFTQDPAFPYVSVRSAHVIGGADDFTDRLSHYIGRVRAGEPIAVHREIYPTTFISHHEIVEFLDWAARADFTGPVNAASHTPLNVIELSDIVALGCGGAATYVETDAENASPFSFDRYYPMSNSRAESLGFHFSRVTEWLPATVEESRHA